MATLEDTTRTVGERATDVRLRRAIRETAEGRQVHPAGSVFLPSDIPDFAEALRRLRAERRRVVVVFPDGGELVLDEERKRRRVWFSFPMIVSLRRSRSRERQLV